MRPLLEVSNLAFSYGAKPVLTSVSFAARAGEFIAIAGANGAGKSTLLDLLSGLHKPAAGTISFAGRDQAAWGRAELARFLSHLPQTVHADLPFRAEQLVAMGRYPHTDRWFESDEDHRAVTAAMQRTHALPLRARPFAALSGGERQRVLLAACLAQDAAVLLLDEPSTFLDVDAQLECFTLLREEASAGKLCLAITHDLNLALTFCTRVLVLDQGVIARDLVPSTIAADPSWLGIFSPRLQLGATPAGAPWIWYA